MLRLLLHISLTLLKARLKQTLVAGVGVMFGITMFIALMGFMTGLNSMLDGMVLNRTPHVRIYQEIRSTEAQPAQLAYPGDIHMLHSVKPVDRGRRIYNGGYIIQYLRRQPEVLGVAPQVNTQVFFNLGASTLNANVTGISPEEETLLFQLNDYVILGKTENLRTIPNSIILGYGLAQKLMAKEGDMVQVTTARGERFFLKVCGYYQSGLADIDNIQAYTSLETAQRIAGEGSNYFTDIQVKLHDLEEAPRYAALYATQFGVDTRDIQTANAQFETGTSIRNMITYAVSITLLIVAGFGIYNILNMLIYEKMDSIAILKATGFNHMDVQAIFIGLALIIGLSGGVMGLIVGHLLAMLIDSLPFETEALPTITTFPVNFAVSHYVIGFSFAVATAFFAGFLPARRAASIDPVDIIRGK